MSFWPTAEEIRAGVTWVRRNPIISAGVVALAIGGAIAYLLSEESSDRAEKKQQPVDSSASSGPIAVVSSEASSIKPLKEGVERTSGATPSSSSTIIPLVPVPTPGSGSAPSSFLTSSSEDLSHSVEAVQPPPAPSVSPFAACQLPSQCFHARVRLFMISCLSVSVSHNYVVVDHGRW